MSERAREAGRAPVRAGFVIDTLAPGAGTENQLILLLRHLDRSRVRPSLCCLWENAALARLGLDVPVLTLDVHRIAGRKGARGVARLRRWAKQESDVLVTFFRDSNIVGTLAGRAAGVPVVSSRRNLGYWHNRRELAVLRVLNRMTHRFVANSEAVRDHTAATEGVDPARIEVIYNAIDVERFRPPEDGERRDIREGLGLPVDPFLIGCVANLRPVKGHGSLITAFASVRRRLPDARLVLVGGGSEEMRLRALAHGLGVSRDVVFLGPRHDTADLMRAFDLQVLPSISEGFSNSLLEGLACGLPCAATDVGGNRELLADGTLGRLVPPKDVRRMGDAMVELALRDDLRRELGEASRRHVLLNFAIPVALDRWHRLLESCRRG